MNERRYSEDEVAAIFASAADAQEISRRPVDTGTGMTLSELQEIGREVGISPEAVARAAGLVGQRAKPTSRSLLGLPIGVGKTIELGRRLTDAEWERLVVDLRETFDARGRIGADGSFRQWTNGNLQALLEPTATGHRLRLKTMKGSSLSLMMTGLASLGAAAVTFIATGFGDAGTFGSVATLSALGLGLIGMGAIRLPSWASLRRRQMDGVIARLAQATSQTARELPVPDKDTSGG